MPIDCLCHIPYCPNIVGLAAAAFRGNHKLPRRGPPAEGPGDTFEDYTKPRQTIPRPKKIIQTHKILDKDLNMLDKTLTY